MEFENLMTKEELAQVAVGTMKRWEVIVQHITPVVASTHGERDYHSIALLIVAGKDADDAIERAYATEHLKDLFLLHDNMRVLFRLFGSGDSAIILDKDCEYYYEDLY